MSEALGRIEKPPAEEYKAPRKLFFVPLVFAPPQAPDELLELVNQYWAQVEGQLAKLEAKLGGVTKVYHELVPAGGNEAESIEKLNKGSYQIVKARLERGAELQPIEDGELLQEFIDWGRCLALGLNSQKVFAPVYESYVEAQQRRNSYIARQIVETLKDSEAGVLVMREGHQVQFPADIQVFYVAPPSLDALRRWLRAREVEEAPTQGGEDSGG